MKEYKKILAENVFDIDSFSNRLQINKEILTDAQIGLLNRINQRISEFEPKNVYYIKNIMKKNFLNRFGSSHSDKGNSSMLNLETMADTLSDIFGQLYQMRAAASLSNLYNLRYSKQERKIAENFAEKFGAEYAILKS